MKSEILKVVVGLMLATTGGLACGSGAGYWYAVKSYRGPSAEAHATDYAYWVEQLQSLRKRVKELEDDRPTAEIQQLQIQVADLMKRLTPKASRPCK